MGDSDMRSPTNDSDSSNFQFTFFDKLKWKVKDKSIEKILWDMQTHKNSLCFMIFIYKKVGGHLFW